MGTTGPVHLWVSALMDKIAMDTKIEIKKTEKENGALDFGEWKTMEDHEGRWLQKVLVQLHSEEELKALHKAVHGKRLAFSGSDTMLQVDTPYLDLDRLGLGQGMAL